MKRVLETPSPKCDIVYSDYGIKVYLSHSNIAMAGILEELVLKDNGGASLVGFLKGINTLKIQCISDDCCF